MSGVKRFLEAEEGASAIEYALLASLIAMATLAAMNAVGTSLSSTFSTVASSL